MTDIWKIWPVREWDQERTCDIDFSRFSMFMTRYGMDKCFSSERASKMELVVSWRQFPRNLEQNFDFPDFQGKQGTSCRKWRQTDMMAFVQFLLRSSWLELVCDTAKTYHLQPSRNDISSGGKKMTGWPSEYVFVGLSQSFYSLSRVMLGYSRMVKIQGPIYFHFTANQITFSPQNFSSKPFTIEKVFTLGIILPPNAFQKLSLAPVEGYWKARGWCDWQLAIPNQYLGIEKKSRYLIRY